MIRFAQLLAIANNAEVTVFHVCEMWMTKEQRAKVKDKLETALKQANLTANIQIKIIRYNNVEKAILHDSRSFDLVVLHSTRYRTAGGFAVSDVTEKLSSQLQTSIIIFNEAPIQI